MRETEKDHHGKTLNMITVKHWIRSLKNIEYNQREILNEIVEKYWIRSLRSIE